MKLLAERNVEINEIKIHLNLYKLYKSFLLLISDQEEMGIGNVTLGNPPIIEGIKSPSASYNLFGMNTKLLSTIIVEKASKALNAPVLLLFFVKNKIEDKKIAKSLINFLNEILNNLIED
ncbi:MAG: hypothetical protein ACFFEN_06905 [Candidatus Thorarchaeota archaeon]